MAISNKCFESKNDDKLNFENEKNFVEVKTGRYLKTNYFNDYDLKEKYADILSRLINVFI